MGKSSGMKPSSNTTTSNGGIMGSGVFGMFGTTIQCKSEDNSLYCSFMKIFNVLIVVIVISIILYTVYSLISSSKGSRRR